MLGIRDLDHDGAPCGDVKNEVDLFGLRVASLFIIGVASTVGALFPVLSRRSKWIRVPPLVFDFAKYFGSGVIIATAFIHLLAPALGALESECLGDAWTDYPWALAISMTSIFSIFFLELIAYRWGSAKLKSIGLIAHNPHGHDHDHEDQHAAHGPEVVHDSHTQPHPHPSHSHSITSLTQSKESSPSSSSKEKDLELGLSASNPISSTTTHSTGSVSRGVLDTGIAQIIGIGILEFGVVFHSVLIGLTLAVDPAFKVLFVVLTFHQTFEGLGLGARLAFMDLLPGYHWVPVAGALLYGMSTPLGIAIGLGVRATYNPVGMVASIVSGVLDSVSSGILLYTGLVELLAHEFMFNPKIHHMSNGKLVFASVSMITGAGLMALLGHWA